MGKFFEDTYHLHHFSFFGDQGTKRYSVYFFILREDCADFRDVFFELPLFKSKEHYRPLVLLYLLLSSYDFQLNDQGWKGTLLC